MSELELSDRRFERDPARHPSAADLLGRLADIARRRGMLLQTCCEQKLTAESGARPGGCIDAGWVSAAVGHRITAARDGGQRPDCLCVRSVDIGATDTCVHHCRYCYATAGAGRAEKAFACHDPQGESLQGAQHVY
jgi:hypothetical protein